MSARFYYYIDSLTSEIIYIYIFLILLLTIYIKLFCYLDRCTKRYLSFEISLRASKGFSLQKRLKSCSKLSSQKENWCMNLYKSYMQIVLLIMQKTVNVQNATRLAFEKEITGHEQILECVNLKIL